MRWSGLPCESNERGRSTRNNNARLSRKFCRRMALLARSLHTVSDADEVYSQRHGQRGLLLWIAAAGVGWRGIFGAVDGGGGPPGVSGALCLFVFPLSGV